MSDTLSTAIEWTALMFSIAYVWGCYVKAERRRRK